MRVSYNGNTSDFQSDARSSILLTRSKQNKYYMEKISLVIENHGSSLYFSSLSQIFDIRSSAIVAVTASRRPG